MFTKKELDRIGDILVSKSIITTEQLNFAITEQNRRKALLDNSGSQEQKVTPLGEVLVELGFIDELQLQRGLNWQQKLRRASVAMALCAPMLFFTSGAAAAVPKTSVTVSGAVTIQTEDFTTMSGLKVESTKDVDGGYDIGWTDAGDWLSYSNTELVIPAAGSYKITYRVASPYGTGGIQLVEANTDLILDTMTVPKTGGWQTWTDVTRTVNLSAGAHTFKLMVTASGFNINWIRVEPIAVPAASSSATSVSSSSASSAQNSVVASSSSAPVQNTSQSSVASSVASSSSLVSSSKSSAPSSVTSSSSSAPVQSSSSQSSVPSSVASSSSLVSSSKSSALNSTASSASSQSSSVQSSATNSVSSSVSNVSFPYIIEAENYSTMSGVYNEPTTDVGGGQDTGNINTGDWMAYANKVITIPSTGQYKITYRVASLSAGGSFVLNELSSGATVDTVQVPVTGDWQNWVDVVKTVTLSQGDHTFKLLATLGGFNVNWIKIEPVTASTSSSLSSSSGTSITSSSSSSAASSSPVISSASSKSASSTSSSNIYTTVAGPIGLSWTAPNARENGTVLDITEVGGYEIRYKASSDTAYTYITINDAWTNTYNFSYLVGDYIFQIAAFDKAGVYSNFIDIRSGL